MAVVCQVPFAIINFTQVRCLTSAEFKGISRVLFFPLFSIGITTILLQLYNMAVLNWFWPFFAEIVVHLIAGILQFRAAGSLAAAQSTGSLSSHGRERP